MRGAEEGPGGGYNSYTAWMTEDILRDMLYAHRQTPIVILISLYTLTFCLGLVGNILVIYVFLRNHKMRTVTNSFLVNLAFCDLMVVCMGMPFSVAAEVYANWVYGNAMCKIVNFSQGLSVSASILTLAVISAERFYAIRRPLRARAFMSRSRIQTIIFAIWVVSGIANIPSLVVRHEKVAEQIFSVTLKICVESWSIISLKHAYNITLLFILYISPIIFICIGYLQIGCNLWRHNASLYASSRTAENNLLGRRRVAKMLFVMAVLFALSWLPYHIMGVLLDFLRDSTLTEQGMLLRRIYSFALWLGHSNSSINPICYVLMSSSFKSALRLELKRCCHRTTHRDLLGQNSFMSLSMSMTVTTTSHGSGGNRNGGSGGTRGGGSGSSGEGGTTTRVYRPASVRSSHVIGPCTHVTSSTCKLMRKTPMCNV